MFEIQRFGNPKCDEPRLLILGGVHGDEPPGMESAAELAKRLRTINVQGLITVVPVVNQPALDLRSRCGPDGIDLARTCPGQSDGSVTERVAAAVSKLIVESTALIDLHSGGRAFEIYPMTGYMMVRDRTVLDRQRQMASAFALPVIWGTSDQLDGRTLSVARDQGIPAIYAEYGGGETTPTITDAYVGGCLSVAIVLGLIDQDDSGVTPSNEVPLVVEETATNSGYMQICHPSPCDGHFEASVDLGDSVTAGQSLGTVVAADAGKRMIVAVEKTGKLIVRRADRRVQRGDSLGVVLGTSENG